MENQLRLAGIPPGALGMLLRAELGIESVKLYVEQMDDRIHAFLRRKGIEDPTGYSITDLSEEDRESFDEWIEFALRAWFMPYVNGPIIEDKQQVAGHLVQYFTISDGWLVVSLTCHLSERRVVVLFTGLHEFDERTGLWDMLRMKQEREMSREISQVFRWTIDCGSRKIFLSRQMAQTLELGREPLVVPLKTLLEQAHPDDLDLVVTFLDNSDGGMHSIKHRCQTDSGKTVHLHSYAAPIFDGERVVRITGISENVTEYVGNEKKLALSERRFQRIIQDTGDLYLVLDSDGRFSYITQGVIEVFGREPEDYLGKHYTEILEGVEDVEDARKEIGRVLRERSSGRMECRVRKHDDGQLLWYDFSIFSVLEATASEVVIVGRNITAQKQRERKLKYLSHRDELTGMYNRFHFWNLLDRFQREGSTDYCLLLVDINGLKTVNDVFGHRKGDRVLMEVAKAVRGAFPQNCPVARVGGGEFAVIVPDGNVETIETDCRAIEEYCTGTTNRMLPVSVSWGVACSCREGRFYPQELYEVAESNMLSNKALQKRSFHSQVASSLKEALRARNVETAEHMERLARLAVSLGGRLGLNQNEYDRLVLLASLHDIGKLAVPDQIINKPGSLTDLEWAIMKKHSEVGYRIAMASAELSSIAQEILCHHERWDGTGYPGGRREGEIPLLAQIISVVDSYDVMTSDRVYHKAMPREDAVAELKRCSGTQFSPAVVDQFLQLLDAGEIV